MKTITIGRYGRSNRCDLTAEYDQVITRIHSGSNTTRPHFGLELRGGDSTISIYAASDAAFNRIKRIVAAGNSRIAPGPEVLGIHVQGPPGGWPHEGVGKTSVRRAPDSIIASASASLPERPPLRFPFQPSPGIEVISLSGGELIKFAPYHLEDSITVQHRNVIVRFGGQSRDMVGVHVMTADADLAARLAASFVRKTPRRLMVNSDVTGICLMLADGTKTNLVQITSRSTAPSND